MNRFSYNTYGQQMTGFDNSIDHSLFGHWSNQEYQEMFFDEIEEVDVSINQIYDNNIMYFTFNSNIK